jgi:iron complex outermembrane recepter protein
MSHRVVAYRFGAGWLVGLLALGAGSLQAQHGALHGVVVDSSGTPVAGVEVSIFSLGRVTRTDSLGRLTFGALPPGGLDLAIRRLGYHAQSNHVVITSAPYDSIKFTLAEQPATLSEVDVSATNRHPFFQGFDQRQQRGIGTFVTREQIDARNTSISSDLFRTMPQVRLIRTGIGMGVRFPSNQIFRGRGSSYCAPMIWIDGQNVPGMEIDDVPVTDIEAIEVYRGAATTPPQFTAAGVLPCGAVVVWTRRRI